AIQLLDRCQRQGRADRPRLGGARDTPVGRRRVHRRGLRRDHDDAGPAARSGGEQHRPHRGRPDRGIVLGGPGRRRDMSESDEGKSASQLISERIAALGDWRGDMLARIRGLIKQAAPGIAEEVKWRKPSNPAGVPVWSDNGIVCTGETYKTYVKFTFMKGA